MSSVPTTISNKPHRPRGVRVSLNTILEKAMENQDTQLINGYYNAYDSHLDCAVVTQPGSNRWQYRTV